MAWCIEARLPGACERSKPEQKAPTPEKKDKLIQSCSDNKPETRNPKPETRNKKPETKNPKYIYN